MGDVVSEFILAYPGTLRTYSGKEEAEAAARLLSPMANPYDSTVHVGIYIYEIEQAGYINRLDLIITEKLKHEDTPEDDPTIA